MAPRNSLRSIPRSGRRRWGRAQLDGAQDPYKVIKKLDEPTVCPQCGAVYRDGRWHCNVFQQNLPEAEVPQLIKINADLPPPRFDRGNS